MTFEEDFPSIKEWMFEQGIQATQINQIIGTRNEMKNIISRHCIDKQKVRDAIINIKKWEHHSLSENWDVELIKELKL